jgi:drug/metabolite transporter (DMT)-like permease
MEGLAPADMTMLRFGVAALLLTPLVLLRRSDKGLGWGRALSLAVLAGPLFGLLINTGFGLAPLSHAVVLTAGATMLSTNALAWKLDGKHPSTLRLIGMAVLILGLVVIASDQQIRTQQSLSTVWLGDLCFAGAGTLWGTFTYALGRWKVDPAVGIGQVSLISAFAFLPAFLVWHGGNTISMDVWLSQAFFQGVLGGCLGSIAIAKAVSRLGAAEASLFPAMVPSGALLLAVPLLSEWPSFLEVLGIVICTLGLLTAFDITRMARRLLPT